MRDRASLPAPRRNLAKNGTVPQPFRWGMTKCAPWHFLAVQGHWANFMSLCFVCTYLWQHENIEFLSYLYVRRDWKGCVRRWRFMTVDILISSSMFLRYWGPYDAKVPLTAHAKCLYDEWLSWCRWMRSCIKWMWRHFVQVSPLL
jgi:hypothetical protein